MSQIIVDFKDTFAFLKGRYLPYAAGIIGKTLFESTAALLEAYLLKMFLDVGTSADLATIGKLMLAVIVFVVIILLLLPLFTFLFNANAKYGHGNVNKAVYGKYGTLPIANLEEKHSGALMSLFVNDTWVTSRIFSRHFRRVVASVVTIVIYLIPMLVLEWRITLILFCFNLLTFFVDQKVAKILRSKTGQIQERMEDLTILFTNMICGMSVIRMYQLADSYRKQCAEMNKSVSGLCKERAKVSSCLMAYHYAVYMTSMAVFFIVGSFMVQKSMTTFGAILSILTLQTALDANFKEFGEYYPMFIHSMAGTERISAFLKQEQEPESYQDNCAQDDQQQKLSFQDGIEFRNVTFTYDGQNNVLDGFCMAVSKGEHIALTGESGCGKSSIAKLLLGFYPVSGGEILIDGVPLNQIPLKQLRELIAYVPQEPAIFCTSILENIRYGAPDADDEAVFKAAKQADAYDFIMEQPKGFNTVIGENGIRLSGGQRQRIAIARAILKNAPILLLDEATSALDSLTEKKILQILEQAGRERTTITIAHRQTSIEDADRVIRM